MDNALQPQDSNLPAVDNYDDLPPTPPPCPTGGTRTLYSPAIARAILKDVATDPIHNIKDICRKHGISRQAFYLWLSGLNGMMAPYKRAMAVRSIAQIQAVKEKQGNIAMEADDVDPADIGNMRKIDLKSRIWAVIDRGAQWRASKWNPALFGDKQTIDLNVGLQPGEARRQAYMANVDARRRREVEAEVQDVDTE